MCFLLSFISELDALLKFAKNAKQFTVESQQLDEELQQEKHQIVCDYICLVFENDYKREAAMFFSNVMNTRLIHMVC